MSRNSAHYNLEVIISIGYRVNSIKATQFRQWATRTLKEYLVKGYAINEKRLAQKEQEVQVLKNIIKMLKKLICRCNFRKPTNITLLSTITAFLTLFCDYLENGILLSN